MGLLSYATGYAFLLTLSPQAHAGTRIEYLSTSQMYVLLASDVEVAVGTGLPKAPVVEAVPPPPSDVTDHMMVLLPTRPSFPVTQISFVPSVRDYVMSTPGGAAPSPALETRTSSLWNTGQDAFPEEQRIRQHSPIDAMLTFSIGGSSAPGGTVSIDGGVAGALWTMRPHQ